MLLRALHARPARLLSLLLLASPFGCTPPTRVHVEITRGQEADTFTMAPPVTQVDVDVTSLDGSVKLRASAPPGGTFDLGDVPGGQPLRFEVTGKSQDGAVVVRGRSLSGIVPGGEGSTVPVFVQRPNRWARPPGGLLKTHVGAPAGVLGEQFVYLAGGTADSPAEGDFYDLLNLVGEHGNAFPRAPQTIVSLGQNALFVDATGAIVIGDQLATDVMAPAGLSFADVAGGRSIFAAAGRVFVVGATRSTAPTRAVLIIDVDGGLRAASLLTPRAGAAALWAPGVGLVVAGGSASGAGVEVLADGAPAFTVRDYPADPVEGAAALLAPSRGVALLGGSAGGAAAPTRLFDPSCAKACMATAVPDAALPGPLSFVAAFALSGGRAIAVGDELGDGGMTRSFLVDLGGAGAVTELPLREPRRGASVIPAPNGTLALLGGLHEDGSPALSVELFFPE